MSGEGKVEQFIRRELIKGMAKATTCPNCGPWALIDSPTVETEKWCPICGHSEPIAAACGWWHVGSSKWESK